MDRTLQTPSLSSARNLKAVGQEERCGWPGTVAVETAPLCKKYADSGPQIFIHQMPKVLTPQPEGHRRMGRQLLLSSLHELFSVKVIFYLPTELALQV